MARRCVPRRPLSPSLIRKACASGINQGVIALHAGFPNYTQYYTTLRAEFIPDTRLTVGRLMRVADLVGLSRDEVFLDSPPGATE